VTDHESLAELLGAYALDAVDPDEAEAIEAHLETCPRCRAELVGHREVAGLLGFAGHEAPAGVWDRIVASMQEPPPALRLERADMSALGSQGSASPSSGAGAGPTLIGSARRAVGSGRRDRSLRLRVIGAVAVAAAVVVAVLGIQVEHLDHKTTQLNREMATAQATAQTPGQSMAVVRKGLASPGARKVVLSSLSGGTPSLDAVVLPDGQGYVYNSSLTPLDSDQTYQLWGIEDATRVSYGVLGSTIAPVEAFRAVPDVQALAVTAEVAGGVVQSKNAPVATGSLPTT
jgi:anti-sigma factor RsiW